MEMIKCPNGEIIPKLTRQSLQAIAAKSRMPQAEIEIVFCYAYKLGKKEKCENLFNKGFDAYRILEQL